MIRAENKQDALFCQRLSDLVDMASSRYCPKFTDFLDGRNLSIAKDYLCSLSAHVIAICYGGFENASRNVVGIFPKDVYGFDDGSDLRELFEISAIEICGSGFCNFNHRDVMGSVLALGIKREVLGDIYVKEDGKKAYIVMLSRTAQYVIESLEFVARDKVKVRQIQLCDLPVPDNKFAVISGTVASERMDCVLALALNLSRDKTKQLIGAGLVNVNHFENTKCDYALAEGDVLSVRGYGRFILHEIGSITRKGRTRTIIHKMI